jgi:Tol biopolymer transport system component
MTTDGSNLMRLTTTGESQPSWSVDGKQMACRAPSPLKIGDLNPLEIFVINDDGSNSRMLTRKSNEMVEPNWSPDGSRIIFVEVVDGVSRKSSIFSMAADGRDLQRITSVPAKDRHPVWSPDGKKIAFHSDRDGNFEIYVLHVS